MQPDYMKMAQAQKAPEEQAKPEQAQDRSELDELHEAMGMPVGDSPEAAKQRLMQVLEELGILKDLEPAVLQQLQSKVDELVKLAMAGDMEAVENHPITQMINQAASGVAGEMGLLDDGAEQPQQPAPPTNFAGMVKPPGGGMSGR